MPDSQKRIAVYLPNMGGGGVEKMRLVLIKDLLRRGHAIDLVLHQAKGELLSEVPGEVNIVALDVDRISKAALPLAKYLRQTPPDGLLAEIWPCTVVAPIAKVISGYSGRVVVTEHGFLSGQYKCKGLLNRLKLRVSTTIGYRLADARVGVAKGIMKDMSQLSQMSEDGFQVIANPASPGKSKASSAGDDDAAVWPSSPGKRILTVGKLKRVKNHTLLLQAFAKLAEADDLASLVILGEGEERGALEALARELGISDRIALPGFIHDTAAYYRSADLFALSSDYEGFGVVIVEAMSYGLPVVSTDAPTGPAEILDNNRYGSIVPVGDADALAEAMAKALNTRHDPERLRKKAAEYTPGKAADSYLALLFPDTPGL